MFWVAFSVSVAVLVVVTFGDSLDLISHETLNDRLLVVPTGLAQVGFALMVLASLVWLAAELVTGFRGRGRGAATAALPARSRR